MLNFGWRTAFFILGVIGLVWAVGCISCTATTRISFPVLRPKNSKRSVTRRRLRSHKLPWKVVSKSANFWLILLMYHTYCWGSFFFISWMPTYLEQGRGFSPGQMKYWAMLPFVIGACGNLFGGWLSDSLVTRIGRKWARRSVGAGGLLLGGILLMATAITPSNVLAAIFLALSYGCQDSMLPVSWAVCMDVGEEHSGGISHP